MSGERGSGGQLLVRQLLNEGVERIFGVPGESYLSTLDALRDVKDRIAFITCRHEGAAGFMAEATGKLTGRPGVVFVTRGPGAMNAAIALHVARQDSTPLVCLIGQVPRSFQDREAFQELDYRRALSEITKASFQVDDPDRMPEYVARAFSLAATGRPGPVALGLPEDVQSAQAQAVLRPAGVVSPAGMGLARLEPVLRALATADNPLVLAGGSGWTREGVEALRAFVERAHLPVVTSFRRQDLLDPRSAAFAGHAALGQATHIDALEKEADTLLVLGTRLDEITTAGYSRFLPRPGRTVIHIHPDPDELSAVARPDIAIAAEPGAAAKALWQADVPVKPAWRERQARLHTAADAFREPIPEPGALSLSKAFAALRARLPADAILTNGAGNFAAWLHRFCPPYGWPSQLAPQAGAMGYGLPAAIAAKLAAPRRTVVAVTGDGEIQMTGQELATAAAHNLDLTLFIVDNAMYGTIRMHQEKEFPGRVYATGLANPDFVAWAQSYGARAWLVESDAAFEPAMEEALGHQGLSVVVLKPDPRSIAPGKTLGG